MGVSKIFQISYSKSAQVVRRRLHAPPAKKVRVPDFLQTNAYKSKTETYFSNFFL
jgi:hypothetical protein